MLPNLKHLMQATKDGLKHSNLGAERILPNSFKNLVPSIENSVIEYYTYTCKLIGRNAELNIYFPNQWFFLAAYMTEYYRALISYKRKVFEVLHLNNLRDAEKIIKPLQNDREAAIELFNRIGYYGEDREYLIDFLSDYNWWGGGKTIDRNDFFVSPILGIANLVNASQSYVSDLCKFLAEHQEASDILNEELESNPLGVNRQLELNQVKPLDSEPLQLIFYGAPGTGKSYSIDQMAEDDVTVRTTFHPDSDYASFVGAYKPTMDRLPISYISDGMAKYARSWEKHDACENKIVYKFVPQAFLKAYVAAWSDLDNPHYLVIEEINRGNCAQIFGDLFQLLDRNSMGSSSYAIHADEDISRFLKTDEKGFANLSPEQKEAISSFVLVKDSGKTVNIGKDILEGNKLLLPPNLRIWATMNTSDQSLFPIDSAFKRRWNWRYVPIDYTAKNHLFEVGGKRYSWGDFLRKINPAIFQLTESADKQMGYFFAKPDRKSAPTLKDNNIISEEIFVNKVLFYLWTDVLKDFDASEPFMNPDTSHMYEFSDFFNKDKNYLQQFIDKLQLDVVETNTDNEDNDMGKQYQSMTVTFADGKVISEPTINETYLKAIEAIGVERAAEVAAEKKYQRRGHELISKQKHLYLDEEGFNYAQIGEFYVALPKRCDTLRGMLELMSNKFDLGLTITLA